MRAASPGGVGAHRGSRSAHARTGSSSGSGLVAGSAPGQALIIVSVEADSPEEPLSVVWERLPYTCHSRESSPDDPSTVRTTARTVIGSTRLRSP